ncbi:MAG: UvrD-helicase domain-containing protein [Xanthobacteraceae bacterium]
MKIDICRDRQRILDAAGHVLVTGGPGCGKTTIALAKAIRRIDDGLLEGQEILFLSFSRAAVARILEAARKDVPTALLKRIKIQTFHAFCWELVRGHGYLLGAPRGIALVLPHDERALRNGVEDDDPTWRTERQILFERDGRLVFDLFAPKTLELLQKSVAFRTLIAEHYPLIIVDEAQDTGSEQWGCVATLAPHVQLVCLADLDQQIYDWRPDVSPERLKEIVSVLTPEIVDLGTQNNRSAGVEIVAFGNDILGRKARGAGYRGVTRREFGPKAGIRDLAIRQATGYISRLVQATCGRPAQSIGFFTNWGRGVTIITRALQGDGTQAEIPHRVEIDEAEVLLASRFVAFCLEPQADCHIALSSGLELLGALFRAKGNVRKAEQLERNAADARDGRIPGRSKAAAALSAVLEKIRTRGFIGDPGRDWLFVSALLSNADAAELTLVAGLVIYLMAFNRGRRIAEGLMETWQVAGNYESARRVLDAAIAEDQILSIGSDLKGINVMTMHKSKGKEFDGVIVMHLGYGSPFSSSKESPPHMKSRRLLRMAVTRARHHVLLLTDVSDPSPLLDGHDLRRPPPRTN